MDGYSAQRAGIIPGDRLMEVGGVTVGAKKPDEVRSLTRGEPGTEVKVVIERDGVAKPIEYVLIREEIQVKNVTYAGDSSRRHRIHQAGAVLPEGGG